ncbi:glycosyltransferase family 2 protein [Schaalia sp. Marseille-Q2122]|uniref:glycosyltransferase family 2 protein n=1 Tax=Schaalia sp. Marseille-Q2122 TaxID=2736604 RepID=UPI00158A9410|nr:glycosyltransferase family 2 protein [Schaalia sp. Marseille-Q2122]
MSGVPRLAIVIPCYNEEAVLPVTKPLFEDKLLSLIEAGKAARDSALVFVDDGSRDATWTLIEEFSCGNPHIRGLRQSRNRGHQSTVLAGLLESMHDYDVTISVDCDGQDDLNTMDEMLAAYAEGAEVVYGVRNDRATDSFFKRFTAESFYRILATMGVEVVFNHADYRLISSRVLKEFASFKEVNLFLRGLIPLVGFKSTSVYYARHERMAGESHYPLTKMLGLAVDGVTSLSVKPIRMITAAGIVVSLLSFFFILWIIGTFFWGTTVPGWASTTAASVFLGGLQLLSLGIIGEYVGKIYMESKERPRYIISERTE